MLRTLLCDGHNRFLVVEDPKCISDLIQRKDHQLWLDIEAPTREEFATIQKEFDLHPLAIEDARVRHQRPKIDQYGHFYFVVFYSVDLDEATGAREPVQVGDGERRGLRGTRFHGNEGAKVVPLPNTRYEPGSLIGMATPNGDSDHPDSSSALNSAMGAGQERRPSAPAQDLDHIVLHEISMFMGENYLITVHDHPIFELDEVARRWYRNSAAIRDQREAGAHPEGTRPLTPEEESALEPKEDNGHPTVLAGPKQPAKGNGTAKKLGLSGARVKNEPDQVDETFSEDEEENQQAANNVGILLYSLLDTIVDGYFPVIDTIVDRIEDLEEQIFEHFNQRAIESVFNLKKDLLAMRKVLAPERDVLNILTRRDIPIFDQHTLVYFQDVYDHVTRITDSIDTYRDLLSSALDSFLSMQSNRLNITVQTLTSVSIMLMTIATFTGWFGMNFEHMPELHTSWGYPALVVVVAISVLLEAIFFKRRGWL